MGRRIGAAWLACASFVLAAGAQAAPVHRFDIPAEPAAEALIDFAIQADISVGGDARCGGLSPPLKGDFTIKAALTRLLKGVRCQFVVVAPDAVRIVELGRPRLAAAAAPAAAAPVLAAAKPEAPATLPEVIVTATRRPAVSAKLAESVSVVPEATLKQAGATDAGDVAAQLAGVTTTNLGPGRDKILLRGLSDGTFTGRTESTVGIYLDDTPITFNAPDPDLRLADVQSVEVLRGPQGFLYGGGSISGVYRIVPQKPQINQWSESTLVGGALTDAGAPSGEFEAMLNVPLAPDVAALRAVVYGEEDGGYIDNLALRKANVDGTTRGGARGGVKLLAGPDWTATLTVTYQRIVTDDTQYITPGLGRLHVANQVEQSSENDFGQVSLTLDHDAPWGDFKSTTAVVRHSLFDQIDASTALPLFGVTSSSVGAYDEPTNITMLVQDAVLTSPNIGRLQWLVGAFASSSLEDTEPDIRANATSMVPSQVLYVEHRSDLLDRAAIYGQVSYAITPRWSVEAGLRAAAGEDWTSSTVQAPQTDRRRLFSGRETSSNLSPKLAVKLRATMDLLVYALVSEGSREGGFNTGGPIGSVFDNDGPGLRRRFGADRLWNAETGLKARLFNDDLTLTSTLFYDIWDNIQTDQFLPSGLSYTANAGDGRNYGAETELAYLVTPRLSVRANALVNAPELVKADPGFTTTGDVGLPGVPDVSAGVEAAYAWPVGGGLTATVSAQSQYIGRSHLTFSPLTSPTMGNYTLNRLAAQLRGRDWRLSAFVINPTNETGDTFSYGNPFNFRQIAEITPQRPLTLRVTLGVDF